MLKECNICKKEFETIYPQKFYCSEECRKKGRILQKVSDDGFIHKICGWCGKEMKLPVCRQTNNRKYCCKECSRLANYKLRDDKRALEREKKKTEESKAKNSQTEVKVQFPDWVKKTRRVG